jgi:hypothetical protein
MVKAKTILSHRSNEPKKNGRRGVQVMKEKKNDMDRVSSNASSNRPRILGNKNRKKLSNTKLPSLNGTLDNRSNLE